MNNGSTRPPEERFMEKVEFEPNSGCWLWSGSVNRKGYGQFMAKAGTSPYGAHRFSWVLHNGPLPPLKHAKTQRCVLHRCDTPACVNPAHLFIGTRADNNADMARKGRHGFRKFARLTDEQVGEIRRRCAAGEIRRTIAEDFGVCRETVGYIARGQTWRQSA